VAFSLRQHGIYYLYLCFFALYEHKKAQENHKVPLCRRLKSIAGRPHKR
jgi:hypothetical protein